MVAFDSHSRTRSVNVHGPHTHHVLISITDTFSRFTGIPQKRGGVAVPLRANYLYVYFLLEIMYYIMLSLRD